MVLAWLVAKVQVITKARPPTCGAAAAFSKQRTPPGTRSWRHWAAKQEEVLTKQRTQGGLDEQTYLGLSHLLSTWRTNNPDQSLLRYWQQEAKR